LKSDYIARFLHVIQKKIAFDSSKLCTYI